MMKSVLFSENSQSEDEEKSQISLRQKKNGIKKIKDILQFNYYDHNTNAYPPSNSEPASAYMKDEPISALNLRNIESPALDI